MEVTKMPENENNCTQCGCEDESPMQIAVEKTSRWVTFKLFIVGLFYENGSPSLTRVLTTLAFFFFLIVSLYLIVKNEHWLDYDTFANITGGGSLGVRLLDKLGMTKLSCNVQGK